MTSAVVLVRWLRARIVVWLLRRLPFGLWLGWLPLLLFVLLEHWQMHGARLLLEPQRFRRVLIRSATE